MGKELVLHLALPDSQLKSVIIDSVRITCVRVPSAFLVGKWDIIILIQMGGTGRTSFTYIINKRERKRELIMKHVVLYVSVNQSSGKF